MTEQKNRDRAFRVYFRLLSLLGSTARKKLESQSQPTSTAIELTEREKALRDSGMSIAEIEKQRKARLEAEWQKRQREAWLKA